MSSDSTEKDLEDLPEDRAEMISMSGALEDIDADEFNEKLKEEAIKEARKTKEMHFTQVILEAEQRGIISAGQAHQINDLRDELEEENVNG